MKKSIYLLSLLVLTACVRPEETLPSGEKKLDPSIVNNPATASGEKTRITPPEFTFETTSHHFGEITEGEKVSYVFRFTNTGGSDLVIASAQGSCGCTVPEFTKEPVKPNQKGEIKVTFDSSGKPGMQSKTVTIVANTVPATKVLTISAEVIKKPQ
jgi:hypothetical protein